MINQSTSAYTEQNRLVPVLLGWKSWLAKVTRLLKLEASRDCEPLPPNDDLVMAALGLLALNRRIEALSLKMAKQNPPVLSDKDPRIHDLEDLFR